MCGGVRGKFKIKCETCGKEREVYYSWSNKRFCSRACKRFTQATKDKIRQTKLGVPIHSEAWKKKRSQEMMGNKHAAGFQMSPEHKQAIINAHTGSKSHLWKDGRCKKKGYLSWINGRNSHRKKLAEGSHTFEQWETMKKEYNFTCPMCYRSEPEIRLTQDHIIPLMKGGSDYIENIQPLCKSCNSRKSTKLIPKIQLVTIS